MSMLSSNRRRLQAGALLAPVIFVQVAAWLLGGGLAAAPAATPPDPAATPAQPLAIDALLAPYRAAPPDQAQQRALSYLASIAPTAPLRSPMAHDAAPEPPPAPDNPPVAETLPPGPDPMPVPAITLTALLNNRTGGMAAIDGNIARVGDNVAPGWRLVRIDHEGERILITSDDGQNVWVILPRDLRR